MSPGRVRLSPWVIHLNALFPHQASVFYGPREERDGIERGHLKEPSVTYGVQKKLDITKWGHPRESQVFYGPREKLDVIKQGQLQEESKSGVRPRVPWGSVEHLSHLQNPPVFYSLHENLDGIKQGQLQEESKSAVHPRVPRGSVKHFSLPVFYGPQEKLNGVERGQLQGLPVFYSPKERHGGVHQGHLQKDTKSGVHPRIPRASVELFSSPIIYAPREELGGVQKGQLGEESKSGVRPRVLQGSVKNLSTPVLYGPQEKPNGIKRDHFQESPVFYSSKEKLDGIKQAQLREESKSGEHPRVPRDSVERLSPPVIYAPGEEFYEVLQQGHLQEAPVFYVPGEKLDGIKQNQLRKKIKSGEHHRAPRDSVEQLSSPIIHASGEEPYEVQQGHLQGAPVFYGPREKLDGIIESQLQDENKSGEHPKVPWGSLKQFRTPVLYGPQEKLNGTELGPLQEAPVFYGPQLQERIKPEAHPRIPPGSWKQISSPIIYAPDEEYGGVQRGPLQKDSKRGVRPRRSWGSFIGFFGINSWVSTTVPPTIVSVFS